MKNENIRDIFVGFAHSIILMKDGELLASGGF